MTEEKPRKCKECKKEFTPKNYYQRFCRDLCRTHGHRRKLRRLREQARKAAGS